MALDWELTQLLSRTPLTYEEAHAAMERMLGGEESPAQIAAFLTALRLKGEKAAEIAGFAAAMRAAMTRIPVPAGAVVVDTCGTGGDGSGTFNISTVVAFVVAGAGAVVAKHGNRSITSRSGSADVLEALGVNVNLTPAQMADCLARCGMAFLFAPALHPALRHVQPVRKALGFRTVFNLLGPLANPAEAPHQVIGAPSAEAARKMAQALLRLGTGRSFVVHGAGGLDEFSLAGVTKVYDVSARRMVHREVTPADFGLAESPLAALAGGDAFENAAIARGILEARDLGARRDVVLVNASAALVAAGLAATWTEGVAVAARSIDSGAAAGRLAALVAFGAGASSR